MDEEFFSINKDGTNLDWYLLKSSGRIKHHGIANIGTIGYGVAPPQRGPQNVFQQHNVMGPPSMPNV